MDGFMAPSMNSRSPVRTVPSAYSHLQQGALIPAFLFATRILLATPAEPFQRGAHANSGALQHLRLPHATVKRAYLAATTLKDGLSPTEPARVDRSALGR